MADATKTILMVGGLGVGGYLIYEYMQYSNAVNTVATQGAGGTPNPSTVTAIQEALPFLTYIEMKFGMAASSSTQALGFAMISAIASGQTYAQAIASVQGASSTQAPGTTSSTQPTSVSNAPGTTSPAPPAPQPISQQVPTLGIRLGSLGIRMQNAIGMSVANADQWNYAYTQVTGRGIDAAYGFNFDAVYGPVVSGARSSGNMTAIVFLQKGQNAINKTLNGIGRLSAIAQYGVPSLTTQGNMLYQAHHPFPYTPTYTLRGLGAVTAPTGFESALFAHRPLRSNRIR